MFFASTLFFVLMFALGAVTSFFDYYSSTKFDENGQFEGNKINRDPKTGYFSRKRFLIGHAVLLGIGILTFPFMGGYAGFWYSIMSLINVIVGILNLTKGKKTRNSQIKLLRNLQTAVTTENASYIDALLGTIVYRNNPSFRYPALFPFVVSTKADQWEAVAEINAKLCELVTKPESEWFKGADVVPTF